MKSKKVYEYAVLRVVPIVEREEFINVGVLMYSRHLRFIGIKTHLHATKIIMLDADADLETIQCYVDTFQKITLGDKDGGAIALCEPHERFRWLTANRSTMIQSSVIHTGLTADAEAELEKLFRKYVGE